MSDAPAGKRPSELATRTLTGLGLIALALVALALGGFVFWLLVVTAGVFMMAEWSDLHGADPKTKRLGQYVLSVPLAIMCPLAAGPDFFALGLLVGAFFFLTIISRRPQLGAGVLYCGLPIYALLLIRHEPDGLRNALWALSLVWSTDIGAYFAGRSIGGPKLAPSISPNKTWAGLIGGIVLATIVAAAMHQFYLLPLRFVLATPLLAILAQAGDLYESHLKRRAGVKDSGSVIPGHGGFLDRLDGVVPVMPVAALLVVVPLAF
ncbi:MAG: phosphatidate cytidylyltransferase [Sphingomonas sp.]|uniref:phosphatidate cytidylyltransferase n=1 Tax=Sphingomonas sp. CD22 TaxID=3100214 RepID=UPI001211EEBF|nr:phosphatidate cytidylyltransferase [Sphingomonas sp. CD22]MEA1084785.1 phosphatidate cytidylyltransferase [Sphingomonas sp. CD22]RZL60022.1 MAG: phosphatidate cytidylyltransferase [Sphingomonas sp.]